MVEIFKTNNSLKKIEKVEIVEKGVWINMYNPTQDEVNFVVDKTGVDRGFIENSLDTEERSHIDTEEGQVLISINVPVKEMTAKSAKVKKYTTIPLGMIIVRDDYIITVSSEKLKVLNNITSEKIILGEFATYKKSRIVFQVLYKVAEEYIRFLDVISKDIEKFEDKIEKTTMQNKELVKLIHFQKSMVYFDAALKSNQSVMERLKRGKIIKLYEEDEDILEDAAIENRQAMEMVTTYSAILNGMIDVFGTMVSNNLNLVMKFLTSITILISVPTLIASVLGMNVTFPFTTGVIGFWVVIALSILATVLTWVYLRKKDLM